jgi:hypothetical protein
MGNPSKTRERAHRIEEKRDSLWKKPEVVNRSNLRRAMVKVKTAESARTTRSQEQALNGREETTGEQQASTCGYAKATAAC